MRTFLVVTMVAGMLAGCGTAAKSGGPWVYAKPGVTAAQRQQDEQACRMQAVGSGDVKQIPLWGEMLNREAYNDCMRARGYDVRVTALER